jgi:hypothetical protein
MPFNNAAARNAAVMMSTGIWECSTIEACWLQPLSWYRCVHALVRLRARLRSS